MVVHALAVGHDNMDVRHVRDRRHPRPVPTDVVTLARHSYATPMPLTGRRSQSEGAKAPTLTPKSPPYPKTLTSGSRSPYTCP
jgi:hypothetical protein